MRYWKGLEPQMNTENTVEMGGREFRHLEITRRIVGVFFEVYGELGYGFLASVYRVAMTMALREAGITAEAEIGIAGQVSRSSIGAAILNFGRRPQIRRLIFTNDRKSTSHIP